ncbi:hypothetical protein [Ruminococcus sp.]|uniref:hypothetical protein n=1 Tax=Ruminococcus sp. TaxID=41978 RepID=UPI001B50FB5A|nr:hypothetical protein [Ruminococcus sp.]MBP5431589.1 hypothetical protein [Ruminococcus sp.]
MVTTKWDGVTDSEEILAALMYFINEKDIAVCMAKSYGDFGKDMRKAHMNGGKGNDKYNIFGWSDRIDVTLHSKNIRYTVTWNKAAKLLHKHLHGERK